MDKAFLAEEIKGAMRAKDKARLSILRLVKNEIDIKEKDSGEEVVPEGVVAALKKVLKQTTETLEGSIKAGSDPARIELLREQVDILTTYLPDQITGIELEAVVARVVSEHGIADKRDIGRAIGLVVAETGGNCDKAEVARILQGGVLS